MYAHLNGPTPGRPVARPSRRAGWVANGGYVYYLFDGPRFGYVTCFVDESDVAYLIWTDEVTRLWGANNADGGLATLSELFDWWVSYGGQPQ